MPSTPNAARTLTRMWPLACAVALSAAACGSSAPAVAKDDRAIRAVPQTAAEAQWNGAIDGRVCNIALTECHRRDGTVDLSAIGPGTDPPSLVGAVCTPGDDSCRFVQIDAVGDGDRRWDPKQSLAGVTCALDAHGLTHEWANGFYQGRLEHCSNGASYDFQYVKVHRVPAP
ncbi:MAG: hypothetical protein U1F43_01335 [Myxococcota bacterium]